MVYGTSTCGFPHRQPVRVNLLQPRRQSVCGRANQSGLRTARRVLTGLGVASGDAIYSGLGLFGMATLITQCEAVFSVIKIGGGAYLLWFAWNSMRHQATPQMPTLQQPVIAPWTVFFRRGLLTDLSNPQTVLFFISIFSVTLSADTPMWARMMAWAGIVLSSVIWRVFLSQAFFVACRASGIRQNTARRQSHHRRDNWPAGVTFNL